MKNPDRMKYVTRQIVSTLLSLSMVILFAGATQAAINCTQCHGDGSTTSLPVDTLSATASYRNITTGAVKGNHGTHSGAALTGAPCARCHGAAAATYTSKHAALKNYSVRMSASMNYTKGTAFPMSSNPTLGTCSTVNCHFQTITPAWGQTTLWSTGKLANDNNANCNTCHATTALTTGAHAKHITAGGGTQASCNQCHPDFNAAIGAAAFNHSTSNTGVIKMSFALAPNGTGSVSGLRTSSTYLPSAATNSTATCSTTYCHGTAATAAWTGGTTNCASCHDASSTGLSTRHDKHYNSVTVPTVLTGGVDAHTGTAYVYACLSCHPTATHATGPVSGVQDAQMVTTGKMSGYTPFGTSLTDAKGFKYTNYGTCTTYCHTRDGVSAAPVVAANWGTASTGSCAVCHRSSGDNYSVMTTDANKLSLPHALHMATDRYGVNTNITCESCHTGTAANNTALQATGAARTLHPNAVKNVSFGTFAGGSWSGTQCSNTYCHSNGTSATGSHAVLSWSGTYSTCAECHGNAASLATGSHNKHVGSLTTVGRAVGCVDCHSATVSGNTTVTGYTYHVDKNVNVRFTNSVNLNTDLPTFAGNDARTTAATGASRIAGSAAANCVNVYCHSSGNINNAGVAVAPTTYVSVAWNTAAIGCDGCHGSGGKSHPVYATGAAASATANSHVKHVENNAFGCDYCHYNTVTEVSVTPTAVKMNNFSGHLNRDVNVRLKLNGGMTGTYAKAAKTCSNTYCHGAPPSPAWGANGSTNCATCHSANSTLPGGHLAHVQTTPLATSYSNMSGNVSSATQYRFSCSACHSYSAGSTHVNGLANANGPAQVFYGFTSATRKATAYNFGGSVAGTDPTAGMNYTAGGIGTCATTYCHSDGNDGIGDKTAITWAAPSSTNRLRCNGCHASQDWKLAGAQSAQNYSSIRTQAHARHIRGDINSELNVGNGIDCYRCHGATVTSAMNSYSTVGAAALNKKRHVNKLRDYSGVTSNPNGGATVSSGQFNPSTHNCSNVYCHSNSKTGTPVSKYASPEAWNSGATLRKCNYCHGRQNHVPTVSPDTDSAFSRYSSTGVPNYVTGAGGSTTANTHRQHMALMGTTDYSNTNVCYSCHAQTLDSTTGRSASAAKFRAYSSRHTSGAYNIKLKAAYGGSYNGTVTTGKTCSTSKCHGTLSPQWGANNDANSSCTKCHGKPTVQASYSTTRALQAAPGYGQAGLDLSRVSPAATFTNGVSTDAEVGAHDAHLRALNLYTARKVLCVDCHTVPTTAIEGNHLNSLTDTELTWSNLAKNTGTTGTPNTRGVLTPAYNPGTGECSANYCHGGRLLDGTDTTPIWNQTTYLTTYSKTTANCNKCHGAPPPSSTYNHSSEITGWPGSTCTGCHGHEGNGATHIDGILQAGGSGCDGCHDYDTVGSSLSNGVWSGGTWGKNSKGGANQGSEGWGSHNKHINVIKSRLALFVSMSTGSLYGKSHAQKVCGTCHSNLTGNHVTGGSDQRTINFGDSVYKVGPTGTDLKFGASNPVFNGANNASSSTNPKTCSNLSCHYFTTPNWSAY